MFINAAGGILTSTHYALVFRLCLLTAVITVVVASVIVVSRAAIARTRPTGFGTVVWAACAAGAVTMGVLTRPGITWTLAAVWAAATVGFFIAQRSSTRPVRSVL